MDTRGTMGPGAIVPLVFMSALERETVGDQRV